MKALGRPILRIVGIIAVLGLAIAVGYVAASNLGQTGTRSSMSDSATFASKDMSYGSAGSAVAPDAMGADPAAVGVSPEAASTASPERMVVSSASIDIRVKDAAKALASIRAIAAGTNSEIANLVVTSGELTPEPVPLDSDASISGDKGPVNAQVTLRIPADKLAVVERQVAKLGTVISQSISEDDVTQQHVDLAARLKNLQAEEARLRTFLTKTNKVSELLEVERELARVRGEIESMQAQLTYLDRQVAMATLSITLAEPGPVVSPGSGGWGLGQAVTDGVRSAAALVRATITVLIAVAPVLIIVGLAVLLVRLVRRRRTDVSRDDSADTDNDPTS